MTGDPVATQQRGNWIKAYRSLMDSAIWPDAELVRMFLWCLFRANFDDRPFLGQVIRRGQFVTGRDAASEQLSVSPSKWYRGMQKLAQLGYISLESNNKWTTVTVCNYTTYQDCTGPERTTDEQRMNNQRTTDEQPANTREELKNSRTQEFPTHTQARAGQELKLPANADTPRNREQLEAWQTARQETHGSRTNVVAWNAEAMLHASWSEQTWFDALQFSTSKSAKSLLDPTNNFQKRAAKSSGNRNPEPSYPKLRPISEC